MMARKEAKEKDRRFFFEEGERKKKGNTLYPYCMAEKEKDSSQ
jgi:hypothetical protein